MWVILVRMDPVEIHIHADRRLAFQVLSAFDIARPDGSSSRVLREEAGRKLVAFHTPFAVASGRMKVYRTVEWVTLHEPQAIEFQGVEGPFAYLRDRFVLMDADGCTRFRYESTFGLRGWLVGWLMARLYAKPRLAAFMRQHSRELRETIEARAKRSRVFPYRECGAR